MDLTTYIVTEQDTLEGLAFKFNMTLYSLLRVNGLSRDSTIFPGKALRVKQNTDESFAPLVGALPHVSTRSNLHIYVPEQTKEVFMRLPAYYCVPAGEVKGTLTITHYVVMFNPEIVDSTYCSVYNGDHSIQLPAAHYQSLLDLYDLKSCSNLHQDSWLQPSSSDFSNALIYLQLEIKRSATSEKRNQLLIPVVLFRLSCLTAEMFPYSSGELESKCNEMCEFITESIETTTFPVTHRSLTHVPYVEWVRPRVSTYVSGFTLSLLKYSPSFDLYAEDEDDFADFQLDKTTEVPILERSSSSITSLTSESIPKPKEPFFINNYKTDILTPEKYAELVYFLPPVLQLRNWELIFSLPTHGCSMTTFYRQSAMCGPSILIIEDAERHIFGGFAPETWRISKMYYGTGEAFIFTFHTENRIKAFFATFENEFYMMSDRESLSMGAG